MTTRIRQKRLRKFTFNVHENSATLKLFGGFLSDRQADKYICASKQYFRCNYVNIVAIKCTRKSVGQPDLVHPKIRSGVQCALTMKNLDNTYVPGYLKTEEIFNTSYHINNLHLPWVAIVNCQLHRLYHSQVLFLIHQFQLQLNSQEKIPLENL